MTAPIRVVVADDQALLRSSFRVLLETTPGIAVVGEASNGLEVVRLAAAELPDIVLMDVRMPEVDGIEATRQICGSAGTADVRIIILTMFDLDSYIFSALRAGASGFLLKDASPSELLQAIRVVAAGEALLAPSVTRRIINEFAHRPPPSPVLDRSLAGITNRERDVLTLVARGLANAEIADHLRVSPATVKTHLHHLLAKLDVRDRAQLVIVAYETGLVSAHSAN